MTGLANRLQLAEDVEMLRARVERYGHTYALVLCDVDHFKRYNDAYGHPAGDRVLRAVAETMMRTCRDGDGAYRYGGEEFLLILPEQPPGCARVVVERLRQAVEGLALPHVANTPADVVTISAGIAVLGPGSHTTVEVVLQEADAALYRAKDTGRNRVTISGRAD